MKNQLSVFFDLVKIEVQKDYYFDFNDAENLRNDIFHGRPMDNESQHMLNLLLVYKKLPRLSEDLIFKYFGADPYEVRYKNWKIVKK
jgi:hypothetical protein